MNQELPEYYQISSEVGRAFSAGVPVVALESTVITHGLPYPQNLDLAQDMEREVRGEGAVPATIAVLDGIIHVGLNQVQLQTLATSQGMRKISTRDFADVLLKRESGGTTVAGTLVAAHAAGIKVFATGGIGGVHRLPVGDVSTDLSQLAQTPLIVVCAGAKAILDLGTTLEYLETWGVPVVGYQTDTFPAFYSRSSGFSVSARLETAEAVAKMARVHWDLGLKSALLVTVPPPGEVAMREESMQNAVNQALEELERKGLRGQEVTPFLLKRVSEISGGESLRANLGLLRNNARVAAQIARQLGSESRRSRSRPRAA